MKVAYVYVTDARGYDLLRHSAVSLALSQPAPCDIHVFCYDFLPPAHDALASALAELNANLTVAPLSDPALEQHETCLHVTKPSLLKLLAVERLVEDYDRVVFLDNDLLIFGDLRIDALQFGSRPIAAVTDLDLSQTGALRNSPSQHSGGGYFNSGFMVFSAENWRAGEFYAKYAAALDAHDENCPYKVSCTSIEQCALNIMFSGNWLSLPADYNMQAGAKFTPSWQTATVRHYCGARKFIPVSPFRNDGRDIRYVNDIRRRLGLSGSSSPWLYELLFQLNTLRHSRGAAEMQDFVAQHA
jgi:lipopolysaccharide biosynthesis glycosyltransferase